METLSPLYSSWVSEASYDSELNMVWYETGDGGATYLAAEITKDDWEFIYRVNEFAGQLHQLSTDFTMETIKHIEKGLLKAKLDGDNLEEYLQDIESEEVKESIRKLQNTPILEELMERASAREGKVVLHGGLVGTALWCVYILDRRINRGSLATEQFLNDIEQKYPEKYTLEQKKQMYEKYLRTTNQEDRFDFYNILANYR